MYWWEAGRVPLRDLTLPLSGLGGAEPTTRGELTNLFVPWRLVFAVKIAVAHQKDCTPSINANRYRYNINTCLSFESLIFTSEFKYLLSA